MEQCRHNMMIQALCDCNDAVIHIKDERQLFAEICRILVEVGGNRMAWVGLLEENPKQTVMPVAFYGFEEAQFEAIMGEWQQSNFEPNPWHTFIQRGTSSISCWKAKLHLPAPTQDDTLTAGLFSAIAIPLVINDGIRGALTVYVSQSDAVEPETKELLMRLSRNLAHGVETIRVNQAREEAVESFNLAYNDLERCLEERTAKLMRVNAELELEIQDRKQSEDEQRASLRLLEIVHKHRELAPLLKEYVSEIKVYTGCDAVGIRVLDEDGSIPYQVHEGSGDAFYESENHISIKSNECTCINVIRGDFDPRRLFFTEGGSFCINATSRFLATVPVEEKGCTRSKCLFDGYETVALFPFRSGGKIYGLLHVADRRENMVPPNMVIMLEKAAMQLGTAFQKVRTENRLNVSEEHYRSLFNNMLNGVAYCRMLFEGNSPKDFVYLNVNEAFENLTGLRHAVGRKVSEVVPGIFESDPEIFRIYGRVALTGEPERFETYVKALGMWFSVSVYSPKREHFVAVFDVINDRKKAELALRESEERFSTVFRNSPVSIGISRLDTGRLVDVNEAFIRMFGHTHKEVIGHTSIELNQWADPHERDRLVAILNEERRVQNFESKFRRKSGEIFDSLVSAELVELTGEKFMLGFFSDISRIKQAKEALRQRLELQEQFAKIAASVPGVVYSFRLQPDGTACMPFSTPMVEDLFGISSDVLARDISPFYANIHPDDLQHVKEVVAEAAKIPSPWHDRFRYMHPVNGLRWIEGWSMPQVEADGSILWHGFAMDITEHKHAEEEMVRVEAQLRQAQKMEALGTLAGGIAHDFNNILGIIVGYTEMAEWDVAEGSPVGRNLKEVLSATHRAKDLVRQILAFSRRTEQEAKPVQVGLIVKEAMKMLRASLPSTLEVTTDVVSKAVIMADPTQVHQVLMNLCSNAAHAMREHGGVLNVSLTDICLWSEGVRPDADLLPGPYVKLSVSDTGLGIDPAILDRIFDPFFTTKEQGVGTGLGLAVVHGIVQSCQGKIEVYSSLGRGTTFHVLLPAMEGSVSRDLVESDPLPKGRERILIVDDEISLAVNTKQVLERLGYIVDYCTNGVDALNCFREHLTNDPYDLVMTDMTMPRLTGVDLARELFKLKPGFPVLLCTGFTENAEYEKALSLGIRMVLTKPISARELAEAIRKMLDDQTRMHDAIAERIPRIA